MAKDKQVSARNIKVDTDNKGVVQLSGTARSREEVDKAVQIAKSAGKRLDRLRAAKRSRLADPQLSFRN